MKDLVKHSKDFVLSKEEIHELIKVSNSEKEEFIVSMFIFEGIRVGELAHMDYSWFHINDSVSKDKGVNHIQIPPFGLECDCIDCQRQMYIEYRRKRFEKKTGSKGMSKDWYKKTKKAYHLRRKLNTLPKLEVREWTPKTKSGARLIPLYDVNLIDLISVQDFVNDKTRMPESRYEIWRIVKKMAKRAFGTEHTKVYPHSLRATCASLWASQDVSLNKLTAIMGWSGTASAKPYIKTGEKEVIEETSKKFESTFF